MDKYIKLYTEALSEVNAHRGEQSKKTEESLKKLNSFIKANARHEEIYLDFIRGSSKKES